MGTYCSVDSLPHITSGYLPLPRSLTEGELFLNAPAMLDLTI